MDYLKDFNFNVSKEFLDSISTIREAIESLESQLEEVNILQERMAVIIGVLKSVPNLSFVSLEKENVKYFKSNKNFTVSKPITLWDGNHYNVGVKTK